MGPTISAGRPRIWERGDARGGGPADPARTEASWEIGMGICHASVTIEDLLGIEEDE